LTPPQDAVLGPLPLTPIQHWFFEQEFSHPHHWNQALLLKVEHPLDSLLLKRVVSHLLRHHDALRLRFEREAAGWRCRSAGPEEGPEVFTSVDLSGLGSEEQAQAIDEQSQQWQASLNLREGPLMRVVLMKLGEERGARLLIVIHHLAVDGVSWRILLEDLAVGYEQARRGEAIKLAAKSSSYGQWGERLVEYANSEALTSEVSYWMKLAQQMEQQQEGGKEDGEEQEAEQEDVLSLPVDYPAGENTQASAQTISRSLSTDETRLLLHEVPAAYHTQINEALLTALTLAFQRWCRLPYLLIEMEGHGREALFADLDISRTVGWFTSLFPVRLELSRRGEEVGEALKRIKEQVRGIPNRGMGYGVLRYLSEDEEVREQMRRMRRGEVSFNYLGQIEAGLEKGGLFTIGEQRSGEARSVEGERPYLLEINGLVAGGRLQLNWTYSENIHRRTRIETLAQYTIEALRSLISHCLSPQAGGYTPSDFALAKLNQQKLDKIVRRFTQR
jgi:non-ribosomal peptide synthase protein (TIGR01720 family)